MIYESDHEDNWIAYGKLKPTIDQTYPKGQLVAIYQGKVGADAADLDGLWQTLLAQGHNPNEVLIARAGEGILDCVETLPEERRVNEVAYRRLRPTIDQTYPPGQFIAIDNGEIVADAPSFRELEAALATQGRSSPDILFVRAGDDTPDFGYILLTPGADR